MVRRDGDSTITVLRDVIRPGTTRGLDFVILEELRKRTGITPQEILKFALAEILCNALDKEDAEEIKIEVQTEGGFHKLLVSDNGGKKLSLEEVKLILDFENKASSKRGFLMVSRGYLGNALKCIFGYSYAIAEAKGLDPPEIVVESGDNVYRINLKPDNVREVINSEVAVEKREDDGFTTFKVKFPKFDLWERHPSSPSVLKDIIFATSMVNPSRKITYNILAERGTLGPTEGGKPLRRETSVLWYDRARFLNLYRDFVKATPEAKLKEFISLFRGFSRKNVIRDILQILNSANHDSQTHGNVQFVPATPIKDLSAKDVTTLFRILREKAKRISKRSVKYVLGCVGKDVFERIRKQRGWQRLRYVVMASRLLECPIFSVHYDWRECGSLDHVDFPYLIELAVFDREEDGEGLKVYQCVNFMASMEDIFSRIFNIPYRLGRVGITKETPVTVVAHLVCPVLKWLNYGKSGLDE